MSEKLDVLAWLDSLHVTDADGAITNRKWPEAQAAHAAVVELAVAVRGYVGPTDDLNIGWRGFGTSSNDLFRCESCGQENLDCTQIPHLPDCAVTRLLSALANIGATP